MAKSRHTNPKYSVVIPAYNEEEYIGAALTSIDQVVAPGGLEVIVVDNNCTDQTVAIAKRFGARVISEKNAGVCWARQAGTKAAIGEIVISTDADTTFSKDWITKIDAEFRRNRQLVAVAGPCQYQAAPAWAKPYTSLLFGIVRLVQLFINKTIYVSATNIAFKKSAWAGYDTNLTQGGDELDLLRNLRAKGEVRFVDDNPTFTSSRRLSRGFLYNVLITFLLYYIVEYNLSRRFGRPVLGHAPAFRDDKSAKLFNYHR